MAGRANGVVEGLDPAVRRIGGVVTLIRGVATQTSLLALNAAIAGTLRDRSGQLAQRTALLIDRIRRHG